MSYDNQLEVLKASEKIYKEVVVFVHNYGANKSHTRRHARLVNSFGLDAAIFNLSRNQPGDLMRFVPFDLEGRMGLRHIWQKNIEDILKQFDGPKILYSFSFPSIAAMMCLNKKEEYNIKAWVCDSGPFGKVRMCTNNYFTYHVPVKSKLVRKALANSTTFLWGLKNYYKDIEDCLKSLDPTFPILNFRGRIDKLVPLAAVNEVFKDYQGEGLNVVKLYDTDHLVGLKIQPEIYKRNLKDFFAKNATPHNH